MFQVGGGSFTHVIKASEPVVSVILGLIINGVVPKPLTALSLLPITYGTFHTNAFISDTSRVPRLQYIIAKLVQLYNIYFTYAGVAYASTLGNLSVDTMSRELTTKAAM